ncbi:MAG: hypothetical protein KGH57_02905 [Candidatus Micrarchaeota archaeon]|nr:hypothetical protein [Candidatus Micrarchaeota archaeon]
MSLTIPGLRVIEVPHGEQRYNTIGDWVPPIRKGAPAQIRVSSMEDKRYVELVALHETVEYELCRIFRRSDQKAVAFDVNYRGPAEEPGDDRRAPYHPEHVIATFFEKAWAKVRRVDWNTYSDTVRRTTSTWKSAQR